MKREHKAPMAIIDVDFGSCVDEEGHQELEHVDSFVHDCLVTYLNHSPSISETQSIVLAH